ncbi:MAG: DUF1361 domain-containing protein [Bacteroidetes bacterium]|nr:DUF1361 domain-containing protein [Bacteroidota bacterium]
MSIRKLPAFERLMLYVALLAFGFLFYRCIFAENFHYTFLLWNLLLAFVPYSISKKLQHKRDKKFSGILLLLGWLLFFPACIYPLTDILHLHITDNFSMVYDGIMIFTFGIAGLLPGMLSLKNIEIYLKKHTSGFFAKVSLLFFITLSSYSACLVGILHIRSWNIIFDFKRMIFASGRGLSNPADHFNIISFVLLFVMLMDVLYAGFKKITTKSAQIKH